jgi:cytochrome P450
MTDGQAQVPTLDLFGPVFQADPHRALREAREQSWCASTPFGMGILRYDEVQAALALRTLRTPGADFLALQGITSGPLVDAIRGFLLSAHGAAHARVRRLVSKAFTTHRVERARPKIRAIAAELVAPLVQREGCEIIHDFADPFAFRVLCAFVGIPESAHAVVHRWTSDLALLFGFSVQENAPQIESALANLQAFTEQLIAERRRSPGDDITSALVTAEEAGELLSDEELRSMIITFLSAGHDTVLHQLGNAVAAFLEHRDQWRLLAATPELAPRAAEEVVRYCPAALLGVPRVATEAVEIRGRRFEEGAFIMPITGSANRDARVFESPDRFDITCERRTHATFGGGIHFCLGAALARAELEISLPLLACALREPILAGPAQWRPPTEAVFGPVRLPIAYQPRADALP